MYRWKDISPDFKNDVMLTLAILSLLLGLFGFLVFYVSNVFKSGKAVSPTDDPDRDDERRGERAKNGEATNISTVITIKCLTAAQTAGHFGTFSLSL